ncbi:MAG: BACON domain-containing protein, partial [Planctomycetota bacterium]
PRVVMDRIDMGADEYLINNSAALVLPTKNIEFVAEGIGSAVIPQTTKVLNYGVFSLNWTVIDNCSWLNVTPKLGHTESLQKSELIVSVDPTYAEYGLNTCQFTVSDPNASNSSQIVTVTLDVLRPEMAISQHSFNFTAESMANSPTPQILTISNTGYDTLNWVIAGADGCDWLTVVPENGQTSSGVSTDVSLSVDPAVAGYGSHSCELTVSDPNAANSPQVVTVVLDVLRPEIGVTPLSFSFECDVDEPNVLTQTLAISNSGYDTLNWQVAEDCEWLSVSPTSGQCVSGPNEVTLTVDTAGLDIGFYNCELTITDDNASNSPQVLPVSLHVYRDGERPVPTEYPTIRQAVEAAVDGDHVIIHPGRYGVYTKILDKQLTIRSVNPTDPAFIHSTIMESGLFTNQVTNLNPLTIEGLSFVYKPASKHQYEGDSGLSFWDTTAQVRNCIFKGWPEGGIVCHGFGGNVLIENCLFEGNWFAGVDVSIRTENAIVEINNCTIVDTLPVIGSVGYIGAAGIRMDGYDNNQLHIRNSILSNYVLEGDAEIAFGSDFSSEMNYASISYSCIPAGPNSITIADPNYVEVTWGEGNIEMDPLFVSRGYLNDNDTPTYYYDDIWVDGDYHLKSEAGHFVWDGFARADFNLDKRVDLVDFAEMAEAWQPPNGALYLSPCDLDNDYAVDLDDFVLFCDDYLQPRVFGSWMTDDVTSPCIDAGDPADMGWQGELWPHGGRINMGAYGGTAQASMSPNSIGNTADLNHDNAVDIIDWSLWAGYWGDERVLMDSDFDRDNDVDPNDMDIFMDNWLWESN